MNNRIRSIFFILFSVLAISFAFHAGLILWGNLNYRARDRAESNLAWTFAFCMVVAAAGTFVRDRFRADFRRTLLQVMAMTARKGLSLGHAFLALADDYDGVRRKTVYRILGLLDEGRPLSDALAVGARGIIPQHVVESVRAAERGGNLADAIESAAEEAVAAQSNRWLYTRSGLYLVTILGIGLWILTFIVPNFAEILQQITDKEGAPLKPPAVARFTLALSYVLVNQMIPCLFLLGIIASPLMVRSVRTRLRVALDPLLLHLPLLGNLLLLGAGERICRALSRCVRREIPLADALALAGAASGNAAIRKSVEDAAAAVREGRPADGALAGLRLPLFVRARACAAASGGSARFATALEALAAECQWRRHRLAEWIAGSVYPASLALSAVWVSLLAFTVFLSITRIQEGLR